MSIKDKIIDDLKSAMKSKNADKLRVLRSLKAKILEKEISERSGGEATITDDQTIEVLMKAAKQRKESIDQFEKGNRADLVENEERELSIIKDYLPKMMDENEIRNAVKDTISQLNATGPAEMGKVMGVMMSKLKGKADGSIVSKVVKEELTQ